ncbi:hypothetical protein O6H91_15G008400 [Diphasiastrum complanatum]|uniref:Uncharacterized protein n=1 Tax=Diphasiastrum complanatum TaxID=34168 RepID=A0ACC2BFG9_DIPCM|nr:hypothetical protein O6H91_15G008400 [Diphasiastrum complanatum]
MANIELKLHRLDRIYHPPDVLDGVLVVTTPSNLSHQGLRLRTTGTISMQLSSRAVGVLESLYTSIKPIQLMDKIVDISAAGKLLAGKTELPFHIALDAPKSHAEYILHETYHGVYINIQYSVTAEVLRGYLQKSLSSTVEFIVEGRRGKIPLVPLAAEPVSFYITQDTQKHALLPKIRSGGFRVTGRVVTRCSLSEPLTGDLTVESCSVPISSIEIQLIRVESVAVGERMAQEKTEIQTTQLADGDICRGLTLPIYIILPRLYTCPTLSAGSFAVEFELSVIIIFDSGMSKRYRLYEPDASNQSMASETLPLRLVRQ